MIHKYIYTIDSCYSLQEHDNGAIPNDLNNDLHKMLFSHKNYISEHYWNKRWDRFKKHANEFELIFTSGNGYPSISNYLPISRSYFKLWEIMTDFEDKLGMKTKPDMKVACLAEGPGGFIEAICNYRSNNNDKIYGMTLISSDKNIPSWKIPEKLMAKKDIVLLRGSDGTGSLYDIINVDSFIQSVGMNSCELVTADGGFDFSNAFNKQEEISTKLIISEIYTTLHVQRDGGTFILKVYDIHSPVTIQLLYLLKLLYSSISFVKPFSSRPANSEKYVVCMGFNSHHPKLNDLCKTLHKCIINPKADINVTVPIQFIYDVSEFNTYYILRQIIHINKTLCCIQAYHDKKETPHINIHTQLLFAIKWCHQYNIKISVDSLKAYVGGLHPPTQQQK